MSVYGGPEVQSKVRNLKEQLEAISARRGDLGQDPTHPNVLKGSRVYPTGLYDVRDAARDNWLSSESPPRRPLGSVDNLNQKSALSHETVTAAVRAGALYAASYDGRKRFTSNLDDDYRRQADSLKALQQDMNSASMPVSRSPNGKAVPTISARESDMEEKLRKANEKIRAMETAAAAEGEADDLKLRLEKLEGELRAAKEDNRKLIDSNKALLETAEKELHGGTEMNQALSSALSQMEEMEKNHKAEKNRLKIEMEELRNGAASVENGWKRRWSDVSAHKKAAIRRYVRRTMEERDHTVKQQCFGAWRNLFAGDIAIAQNRMDVWRKQYSAFVPKPRLMVWTQSLEYHRRSPGDLEHFSYRKLVAWVFKQGVTYVAVRSRFAQWRSLGVTHNRGIAAVKNWADCLTANQARARRLTAAFCRWRVSLLKRRKQGVAASRGLERLVRVYLNRWKSKAFRLQFASYLRRQAQHRRTSNALGAMRYVVERKSILDQTRLKVIGKKQLRDRSFRQKQNCLRKWREYQRDLRQTRVMYFFLSRMMRLWSRRVVILAFEIWMNFVEDARQDPDRGTGCDLHGGTGYKVVSLASPVRHHAAPETSTLSVGRNERAVEVQTLKSRINALERDRASRSERGLSAMTSSGSIGGQDMIASLKELVRKEEGFIGTDDQHECRRSRSRSPEKRAQRSPKRSPQASPSRQEDPADTKEAVLSMKEELGQIARCFETLSRDNVMGSALRETPRKLQLSDASAAIDVPGTSVAVPSTSAFPLNRVPETGLTPGRPTYSEAQEKPIGSEGGFFVADPASSNQEQKAAERATSVPLEDAGPAVSGEGQPEISQAPQPFDTPVKKSVRGGSSSSAKKSLLLSSEQGASTLGAGGGPAEQHNDAYQQGSNGAVGSEANPRAKDEGSSQQWDAKDSTSDEGGANPQEIELKRREFDQIKVSVETSLDETKEKEYLMRRLEGMKEAVEEFATNLGVGSGEVVSEAGLEEPEEDAVDVDGVDSDDDGDPFSKKAKSPRSPRKPEKGKEKAKRKPADPRAAARALKDDVIGHISQLQLRLRDMKRVDRCRQDIDLLQYKIAEMRKYLKLVFATDETEFIMATPSERDDRLARLQRLHGIFDSAEDDSTKNRILRQAQRLAWEQNNERLDSEKAAFESVLAQMEMRTAASNMGAQQGGKERQVETTAFMSPQRQRAEEASTNPYARVQSLNTDLNELHDDLQAQLSNWRSPLRDQSPRQVAAREDPKLGDTILESALLKRIASPKASPATSPNKDSALAARALQNGSMPVNDGAGVSTIPQGTLEAIDLREHVDRLNRIVGDIALTNTLLSSDRREDVLSPTRALHGEVSGLSQSSPLPLSSPRGGLASGSAAALRSPLAATFPSNVLPVSGSRLTRQSDLASPRRIEY